jgi:acyl dehydratase
MADHPGDAAPVTSEVADLVGTEIMVARGEVVTADFQRWAASVGDRNPVYFDDAAARAAGHRGIVMPPLYIAYVCEALLDLESLHPDGSRADDPMLSLPFTARRLMAAGEDVEVHAPVHPGDLITARCAIAEASERSGASGAFVLLVFDWVYTNQDGVLVTTTRTSIVVR